MRTGYAYEACRQDWSGFLKLVHGLKAFPHGALAVRALAAGAFAMAKGYPDSFAGRIGKLRTALSLRMAAL